MFSSRCRINHGHYVAALGEQFNALPAVFRLAFGHSEVRLHRDRLVVWHHTEDRLNSGRENNRPIVVVIYLVLGNSMECTRDNIGNTPIDVTFLWLYGMAATLSRMENVSYLTSRDTRSRESKQYLHQPLSIGLSGELQSLEYMSVNEFSHTTVLLEPTVTGCVNDLNGIYVDGTFGRGGHTRLLLSRLEPDARVIGFDKDPRAIETGRQLAQEDKRFTIVQASFADMKSALEGLGITRIHGVLLDLGVSSPQLDDAERGFSFMRDGPLDMRMNPDQGLSAAEWLATTSEAEIARVLKVYGEERFARRMAKAIVMARAEKPIERTLELANLLKEANPAWEKHKHPATRGFQAIRIAVNNELGDLEQILDQSVELLLPGGRLSVISFHSLEDRIVKRFIRDQERGKSLPPEVPVMDEQLGRTLKRIGKAIMPTSEEVAVNSRARSAVLRIAERLS